MIDDNSDDIPTDDDYIIHVKKIPDPSAPPPVSLVQSPLDQAGLIALKRSIPQALRTRLLRKVSTALILVVPTADWCDVIKRAAKNLVGMGPSIDYSRDPARFFDYGDLVYFVRSEADRMGRPDMSGNVAGLVLAAGGSVVGIAADIGLLPAPLLQVADFTIDIQPLTGKDLQRIIRATTGARRCPAINDALAASITPTQLGAAIRKGTTAIDCVNCLKAIGKRATALITDDDLPTLDQLAGFGDARAWGLSLKADIDRRRADPASTPLGTITRSLLIAGPPGVGKSYFASVLAKTCGIPLIVTSFGDWQAAGTGHLGDVMQAMKQSFSDARQAAIASGCGACLLIDEIDSLVSREQIQGNEYAAWWTTITNAALTLAERSNPARRGVILIACTNYPANIDPALTRSGRLDRTITLALPDSENFARMVRTHLGNDLATADLSAIALAARGMSPADAARIVRDARQAARNAGRALTLDDLVGQVLPAETRSAEHLRATALHEAAHAVTALTLGAVAVDLVTLVSPGLDGATHYVAGSGEAQTRARIEAQVVTSLAGRAADATFGVADTGAGSDLARLRTH